MSLLVFLVCALLDLIRPLLPEVSTVITIIVLTILVLYILYLRSRPVLVPARYPDLAPANQYPVPDSARNQPVNHVRVVGDNPTPLLDQFNFNTWFFMLSTTLEREGLLDAINRAYPQDHLVNRQAMCKILKAVPEKLQPSLGSSFVAFEAMQNLRAKYGTMCYTRLSRLEEDIKSTKLDKLDDKSVSEHLDLVEKKIQNLRGGGAIFDKDKHLGLLADTLPDGTEWSSFKDTLAYGTHSVDEAIDKIKDKCRKMNQVNSAFFTRSKKPRMDPAKEAQRAKDIANKACFYCHKPGHAISNCSERVVNDFKKSNKATDQ